ncbi:MAG: hypothetical protein D9V47_03815 [Clostridia bacterium]|nr:MAG: hypothetical protein D9V47_03815 [Clostridia bacterium]
MDLQDLGKAELLDWLKEAAKLWYAHDGLWFQAVEDKFGLEAAIELDKKAWSQFTVVEADRIKNMLGLGENPGLEAVFTALKFRLAYRINDSQLEMAPDKIILRNHSCRVQSARKRKGLADFACQPVGIVQYSGFARAIDPRVKTTCVFCPPDDHPEDTWCRWEFSL